MPILIASLLTVLSSLSQAQDVREAIELRSNPLTLHGQKCSGSFSVKLAKAVDGSFGEKITHTYKIPGGPRNYTKTETYFFALNDVRVYQQGQSLWANFHGADYPLAEAKYSILQGAYWKLHPSVEIGLDRSKSSSNGSGGWDCQIQSWLRINPL